MKKVLLIIFIFYGCIMQAQNLVPNPSFEVYDTCPNTFSQIENAIGWISLTSSCDFYNSCSINPDISVPNNVVGHQIPVNENCHGYSGIYVYVQPTNYREYVATELNNPLIIGEKYFLSFYVSLADNFNCGINKIGFVLTTTSIHYNGTIITNFINYAHLFSSAIITDKNNWTRIYGTFVADSNYNYINIGNFFDNNNTDTIKLDNMSCSSYYYIDDICVSTDSLSCEIPNGHNTCDTTVEVSEIKINIENITLYPNPTNGKILIDLPYFQKSNIKIYNSFGRLIFVNSFSKKDITIDLSLYPDGVYIIQLMQNNQKLNKKIILIK